MEHNHEPNGFPNRQSVQIGDKTVVSKENISFKNFLEEPMADTVAFTL